MIPVERHWQACEKISEGKARATCQCIRLQELKLEQLQPDDEIYAQFEYISKRRG